MGYSTDFKGQFTLNKKLDEETYTFLYKLANTRRMKRHFPNNEYGVDGEFFVDGKGFMGQDNDESVVDFNIPPSTQPSLWYQWISTKDRLHIKWNETEKFYYYIEWLEYIITKILQPKGYVLNGEVRWQGESSNDTGTIIVINNYIFTIELRLYKTLLGKAKKTSLPLNEFLNNPKNLPPLIGLSDKFDKWIEKKLKGDN